MQTTKSMKKTKDVKGTVKRGGGTAWAERVWKASWAYIRTMVDTVREPFIILDHDLRVIAANEAFYRTFQVPVKDTENKLLYDLGDGQWDIPALRKLLKDISKKETFFRGFEVTHDFPVIGRKVMLLNARRIHQEKKDKSGAGMKPIILLAIEDITEITSISEKLAGQTKEYEAKIIDRTRELERRLAELKDLNETVAAFSSTVTGLTTVIGDLNGDIVALRKK